MKEFFSHMSGNRILLRKRPFRQDEIDDIASISVEWKDCRFYVNFHLKCGSTCQFLAHGSFNVDYGLSADKYTILHFEPFRLEITNAPIMEHITNPLNI